MSPELETRVPCYLAAHMPSARSKCQREPACTRPGGGRPARLLRPFPEAPGRSASRLPGRPLPDPQGTFLPFSPWF